MDHQAGCPKQRLGLRRDTQATLGFSSKLWESTDLLNQNSPMAAAEDAKYDAYNKAFCPQKREHGIWVRYNSSRLLLGVGIWERSPGLDFWLVAL